MDVKDVSNEALRIMGLASPETPSTDPEPAPAPAAAPTPEPVTPQTTPTDTPAEDPEQVLRDKLKFYQTEYQQLKDYTAKIDPTFEQNYLERARARRRGAAPEPATTAPAQMPEDGYLTPEQIKALARDGSLEAYRAAQSEIETERQIRADLAEGDKMVSGFVQKFGINEDELDAAVKYVNSSYRFDLYAQGGPQSYARAIVDRLMLNDLSKNYNQRVASASASASEAAKAAALGTVPAGTSAPLGDAVKTPEMARLEQMRSLTSNRTEQLFPKKT